MRLHLKRSRRKVYTDTARTAEEAKRKLDENSYDAVVSEYSIGDQNAIQLCKHLNIDSTPFIIHSKFYSPILEEKARKNGATFQKKRCNDQYYLDLLNMIDRNVERGSSIDIDFRPDIVCVFNWEGHLVRYNEAFIESIDLEPEEVRQLSPYKVFEDKKKQEVREVMSEAASLENVWTEAVLTTPTALVNYDLKVSSIRNSPETRIGMVGISREELTFLEPQEADLQKPETKETTEIRS